MTSKGRTPESQQQHHEEGGSVFRIPPYHYIHVLDQTSNVTRIELGPNTFIRKDNEKVILRPTKMVIVPPRHFCSIRNPVKKDENGEPLKDALNQVMILYWFRYWIIKIIW